MKTVSQSRASPKWRHFKALMRKNFINYKRTPSGTAMEFLAPVFIMLVLSFMRYIVEPFENQDFDIYQLKKPFYPTTTLDPLTGNWTHQNYETTQLGLDLIPFMKHSDYIAMLDLDNDTSFYNPMLDPISPFYFFPSNCYGKNLGYFSPVVAYVSTGNQIEEDFAIQLSLLFEK